MYWFFLFILGKGDRLRGTRLVVVLLGWLYFLFRLKIILLFIFFAQFLLIELWSHSEWFFMRNGSWFLFLYAFPLFHFLLRRNSNIIFKSSWLFLVTNWILSFLWKSWTTIFCFWGIADFYFWLLESRLFKSYLYLVLLLPSKGDSVRCIIWMIIKFRIIYNLGFLILWPDGGVGQKLAGTFFKEGLGLFFRLFAHLNK